MLRKIKTQNYKKKLEIESCEQTQGVQFPGLKNKYYTLLCSQDL